MDKERNHTHYSDKGGHRIRGDFWKEVKRQEKHLRKKQRQHTAGETFRGEMFSPLVGHEVLLFHYVPNEFD